MFIAAMLLPPLLIYRERHIIVRYALMPVTLSLDVSYFSCSRPHARLRSRREGFIARRVGCRRRRLAPSSAVVGACPRYATSTGGRFSSQYRSFAMHILATARMIL